MTDPPRPWTQSEWCNLVWDARNQSDAQDRVRAALDRVCNDARDRGLIVPDPEPEDEVEAAIEELLDAVKAMGEWRGGDAPPSTLRDRVYVAAERVRGAR